MAAELVGYSGFSASNYLTQPYNADLDFGTGDFSIMGWFKQTTYAGTCVLLRRNTTTGLTAGRWNIQETSAGALSFGIESSSGSNLLNGATVKPNVWHFLVVKRSGTSLTYYLDNILKDTETNSVSLNCANAELSVGANNGGVSPFTNGSLALLRISATAPTAAQIKEIYEAEKPLFQENAKCTLNGTSDAVQCLAYDDSTELLHVGTSGGRSTFQGLRRVDETATNTTEISAQGGMIIEETA